MRQALEETARIGKAVLVHAEIPELSNGTVMAANTANIYDTSVPGIARSRARSPP